MAGGGELMIDIPAGKKIYFASDQHFGAPNETESRAREQKFIQFLNEIKPDTHALFLLGDLFDFWFEYKQVVPRGYLRVLGKLAEFADAGIPIYFFIGNHDLWMRDYLEQELNAQVFSRPQVFVINGKKCFIGHGDGLGPGDKGYKRLKKLFTNPLAKKMFYLLHPDFSLWLGKYLSRKNRYLSGDKDDNFYGDDEWLVQYAKRKLSQAHYDYFVFGHRHLPLEIKLSKQSEYINTGDWLSHFTYAVFEDEKLSLKRYIV
ncbi:UDP-2,3-diacylglucosamine diphosphatase [Ornithobacterium rhinotracheale]|uniref:UDP-2,3-diacylglucosamine diphosphatase n=1 Tax=Ornithobacterium rhinotracheale TaxID=28251 RepID=UPI003FA44D1B